MSALSLRGVGKRYGEHWALRDVDLELAPGRVHAVVGANGAGKSTLVNVIAGLEPPSSGALLLDGVQRRLSGRSAALRHGIGLVAQQLSLVETMTLAENLALASPEFRVRRRRARARLLETAERVGVRVAPDRPVAELSVAQRQLGELTIALAQGAQVLLLDEPTSAIGPHQVGGLFEQVRKIADDGAAVVLVTHRLPEVRDVADDVTVLAQGRITLQGRVSDFGDAELVTAMVGSVPAVERSVGDRTPGPARLEMRSLTARADASHGVTDLDLTVRGGEVLGVLGVAGNGQRELADAAAGHLVPRHGEVLVDGVPVTGRPAVALQRGLGYLPEDRSRFLLAEAPLWGSAIARRLHAREFGGRARLDKRAARRYADRLIAAFDVRPTDPNLGAGSLSGGNQQKLVLGREVDATPAVVVLHGPTQGLDLHAAALLRGTVRRVADDGAAVLLISAEFDEVEALADRVVVLSGGRIVDEFPIAEWDLQRVGAAMAEAHRAAPGAPDTWRAA
ncbi:ABC transporter ATP-binding protein [Nocardioides sp. Bht2]|uniref:ABC transporter ATP-binding protein n=1 Tax=Nocardioides sp. Bht2 TaxID=3392297 RepID=UPI0039B60A04